MIRHKTVSVPDRTEVQIEDEHSKSSDLRVGLLLLLQHIHMATACLGDTPDDIHNCALFYMLSVVGIQVHNQNSSVLTRAVLFSSDSVRLSTLDE
jgi:hypothetical protein